MEIKCLSMYNLQKVGYDWLITASKHLIKELKILKIFGISVFSIFNVNEPYLCKFTVS